MNNDDTDFPYDAFIDGLEEAIYWHNAWFTRGMRQLLFLNQAREADMVARDAHTHCKLGCFLSAQALPAKYANLKTHIDEVHHQMHTLMREAILERKQQEQLNEATFNELKESQMALFIALHGLLRTVIEDKYRTQHSVD